VEDVVVSARPVLAVTTVIIIATLTAACGPRTAVESRGTATTGPDTSGVLVSMIQVRAPIELPAQLYVEHDATVVARSAGIVDSVLVDLGSRVASGAALARLESVDQDLALAHANATYENVGRLANRARAMTKAGGVTVADSEQVEFQYTEAELARRKARRDVELTRIVAPFTGVVTARYARPGRYVQSGDTLFRVTEPGPLLARVRVPEGSAAAVRVGDRATVAALGGATSSATVLQAAPAIDPASGTREVVLRVVPNAAFLPGASVTVRLGNRQRAVVAVPREAVSPDGYALVMENGRTVLRPVTIGADVGEGRVEIVSGLASGERVARTASAAR
jgi:RND family efflux transporter MFP subunit